jgi:excisionase family DNA binding protein
MNEAPTTSPASWHLLSIKEVAAACQLSEKAVRRAIDEGELPAVKLRSRLRVTPQDLDAWIASSRRHGGGERREPRRRVARPAAVGTFRFLVQADDERAVEI